MVNLQVREISLTDGLSQERKSQEVAAAGKLSPDGEPALDERLILIELMRRRQSNLANTLVLSDDERSFGSLVKAAMKCPRVRKPCFYQYSPAYLGFEELERRLGLFQLMFKGDESRVVASHGVTEGEMFDALTTRFSEYLNKPGFRRADRAWRSSLHSSMKECSDFLVQMKRRAESVTVLRHDFFLTRSWSAADIVKWLAKLKNALKSHLKTEGLVGAISRMGWSDSTGWRIHIVCFLVGHKECFGRRIQDIWHELTEGTGGVAQCAYGPWSEGSGSLGESIDPLRRSLLSMLAWDEVRRLNVIGIGHLQFIRIDDIDAGSDESKFERRIDGSKS